MYSLLTWLITNEESHRTSSPVTPSMAAIQSPDRTTLYSALIGRQKFIFIIIFSYLFFYKALLHNVLLFNVVQALSN